MEADNKPTETPKEPEEVTPLSAEQEDQLKGGVSNERLTLNGLGNH